MNHPMLVTLDTNVLTPNSAAVRSRAAELGFDVAVISVTGREAGSGSSGQLALQTPQIAEAAVFDESRFGNASFAGDDEGERLEFVLRVIADNGFPPPHRRSALSPGHRRQLRDAMIFSAHVRERRNLFVTADSTAFVNNGRREVLEQRFGTRILTPEEFLAEFDSGQAV